MPVIQRTVSLLHTRKRRNRETFIKHFSSNSQTSSIMCPVSRNATGCVCVNSSSASNWLTFRMSSLLGEQNTCWQQFHVSYIICFCRYSNDDFQRFPEPFPSQKQHPVSTVDYSTHFFSPTVTNSNREQNALEFCTVTVKPACCEYRILLFKGVVAATVNAVKRRVFNVQIEQDVLPSRLLCRRMLQSLICK